MKKTPLMLLLIAMSFNCSIGEGQMSEKVATTYHNPVVKKDLPDPTVIKADDGFFYLYATGRHTPIYQSKNLVDWKQVGDAFTEASRPSWEPNGGIWAPDINYINGKYVLYYSMSVWGGEQTCGIGVAVADSPQGPFTDRGMMFRSNTIGVQNSIDQFYIEDGGKKYLVWGSFRGIYCMELSDDGLSLRKGAKKVQIAGTATEGSYIHKRGKYYYLFGSAGTCCEGEKSTYRVVYGRSEKLLGPYVNKSGESMMDNHYEVLLHGGGAFVGTGHNTEFVTDDAGNDWMLYHSYLKDESETGRVLMLDQIKWDNDWPYIETSQPSSEHKNPVFGSETNSSVSMSGNPIDEGWYADPHAVIYDDTYWIYATYSHKYEDQIFMDCFSSKDLVHWQKHPSIIDTASVKWAKKCLWAPAPIRKNGKYYLFFAANDVHEGEIGGIGVGVADAPEGPYKDLLGKPLINEIVNGAQPIDQFVYEENGEYYMYYGGWGHCNVVRLKDDFTGLLPFDDGTVYREITPDKSYVEGSFMVKRNGQYVFMWSEGGWTTPNYCVAYGVSDSPFGPFKRIGTILQSDPEVGTGAGHHSLICLPGTDEWYIFYHRHPLGDTNGNHRQVCIDRMEFESPTSNIIKPVKITKEGVESRPLRSLKNISRTSTERTYTNPLPVKFGDPYILLASDGLYYLYGTGGEAKDGFCAYSSSDLVHWKSEGQVFYGTTDGSWGVANFWAPEVYERGGKFYMLYSADWKVNPTNEEENFRIGVAVADAPAGPFRNLSSKPLFDPGYPAIDGTLVDDGEGHTYLYYSRCCYKHPVKSEIADKMRKEGVFNEIEESWIYGIEVKPDLTDVIGEPVLLLRPPVKLNDAQAEWESRSVTSGKVNRRWSEGPCTFKKGDTYYLMYSANYFGGQDYAVGYATSKSPLGEFKKSPDNPVLQKNVDKGGIVTGTGHNNITWSKDGKQMYCVYHGRTQATGDERMVFIDRMSVDENGHLHVAGPTTTPQMAE